MQQTSNLSSSQSLAPGRCTLEKDNPTNSKVKTVMLNFIFSKTTRVKFIHFHSILFSFFPVQTIIKPSWSSPHLVARSNLRRAFRQFAGYILNQHER